MNKRNYNDLNRMDFKERYEYLKLSGRVGVITFGYDRFINQSFYGSPIWRRIRRDVILRDNSMDLGCVGFPIMKHILVHHMNPIDIKDLTKFNEDIINPLFLITVSFDTHQALHYGRDFNPRPLFAIRYQGDTNLW
jgi:hypothetical protein